MILSNQMASVWIEEAKNLFDDSAYNKIFNFQAFHRDDTFCALDITIASAGQKKRIKLYCDIWGNIDNNTILDDDRLVIIKGNTLYNINTNTLDAECKYLDDLAGAFGLYKTEKGYLIHGEMQILMLDSSFGEVWSFVGADIFATANEKTAFKLENDLIELYDFANNYYLLDLDGRRIK